MLVTGARCGCCVDLALSQTTVRHVAEAVEIVASTDDGAANVTRTTPVCFLDELHEPKCHNLKLGPDRRKQSSDLESQCVIYRSTGERIPVAECLLTSVMCHV